tara:strand:+ start:1583 stop:1768 length:186 start_codon:yes stop_codon:yes gene_type:complete
MRNMSYCRFENTLESIEDCINSIEENRVNIKDMSRYELLSYSNIIGACKELICLIETKDLE